MEATYQVPEALVVLRGLVALVIHQVPELQAIEVNLTT